MCIGAAIQCGIDEIVFAVPDIEKATSYLPQINKDLFNPITVRQGILHNEAVKLMKESLKINSKHPGIEYLKLILKSLK